MSALRVSLLVAVALAASGAEAPAQAASFDDRPTGFLTARIGGMPADAWKGTSVAAAKRLVSALPAAPSSRALGDLQFKVLVSELTPPPPDGSPPPSLFIRRVEKLAAMGEAETLNEMVRNAGAYADPTAATYVANALMMAGERQGACAIVRNWELTEPFGRRAQAACNYLDGDKMAASGVSLEQVDGPTMMMLDLTRTQPPASLLRSTQPPVVRARVGMKSPPMAARLDIGEQAQSWMRLAVADAHDNPRTLNALDRLMSLAAIAGIDDPKRLPPAEVNRWYATIRQDDPARAALRGAVLLELFRATGIDVPAGSTDLPDAPPAGARLVMPAAATLQALQAAGAGRCRAEASLLASIAAGETPLAELHPGGVEAIVRVLRQAGEDHAARRFAIETAMAYGL